MSGCFRCSMERRCMHTLLNFYSIFIEHKEPKYFSILSIARRHWGYSVLLTYYIVRLNLGTT